METPRLVLASASPARSRLLEAAGINALIWPSDFDESLVQSSDPIDLVQTLALRKAETVAARFSAEPVGAPLIVIGCDSVLAFGGEAYGKPDSAQAALARWKQMRGQSGDLCTGHACIDLGRGKTLVRCGVTRVYFANVSDRQLEAYVATGEPLKCAGAFALEGQGSLLIDKIEGCYTNVIGLSMPLLREMLNELGYDPLSLSLG
ncbi:septum formation inhibitor Maf [Leptolyngbya sp. 'hensonii']|uniref:Maf family protein n=1 Tax=Leptolyngbya sp. 'hensonii' TaxID=1922337 RepID=UPI00094F80D5|nr:nucleoside triphosphate pyrophosphatase [Leptolyngbya sp. 'hensonii']OLP17266.1 septum formation inhibitor Maf [Leptolyngbya sp. 'hensonii']